MTFLPLKSADYATIAHAEAIRREHAAARNENVSEAQRRQDARDWKAIVARARFFDIDRQALPFVGDEPERLTALAAIVLRTTRAALRKWREGDRAPRSEEEARAFLLLSLARKFAELAGDPRPYVDADGQLYHQPDATRAAEPQPQEKAV